MKNKMRKNNLDKINQDSGKTSIRRSVLESVKIGALTILACLATNVSAQVWVPDSRKVVIEGTTLTQVDTETLSSTAANEIGAAEKMAFSGLGSVQSIAFSPKDASIAFVSNDGKLMLASSLTSTTPKQLEINIVSPVVWSPDGKFIGCVRSVDKGGLEYRSISVEGGVSAKTALPFTKLSLGSKSIAWIPMTDNVVLAGGDGVKSDLYLIEQGAVVPLTMNGQVQGYGVSAKGDIIRWAQKSKNTHVVLTTLYDTSISLRTAAKLDFPDKVTGVNSTPAGSVDNVSYVVFSPDLNRIVFSASAGSGESTVSSLWSSDIIGSAMQIQGRKYMKKTVVKQTNSETMVTALPEKTALPNFSPDGKWLAYLLVEGGQKSIFVFDPIGSAKKAGVLVKE